jgi:hypothetical protein
LHINPSLNTIYKTLLDWFRSQIIGCKQQHHQNEVTVLPYFSHSVGRSSGEYFTSPRSSLTETIFKALTEEDLQLLRQTSAECKTESGVSEDVIKRARKGDLEDDPKLKMQLLCIFKALEIVAESGEIEADTFKEKLTRVTNDDEESEKIVEKCTVTEDTPEDTAFEVTKCVLKDKPNFFGDLFV